MEFPIYWSTDGRSVYVRRWGAGAVKVFRVDLVTGRRELWKELQPADLAGFTSISGIDMAQDGRAYAYSYPRTLSTLYIADGYR